MVARDGSVWTTTAGWLWVLRPEAQRFERTVEPAAARARIFEARDGRIWLSPGGSRPIHAIAGSLQPAGLKSAPPSGVPSSVEPSGEPMLIDRDGVLWAARAAGGAGTIVLADDRQVRRLNARHRGRNKPTNVLTYEEPAPELILARGVVAREAAAARRRAAHHLAHLVVHVAQHLRGHDHHHPGEARRMEMAEARILHRIGVPNPWRRG